MNKPGKGISKSKTLKEDNTDFGGFFRILKNRFWNISSLNMLYIVVNFPLFFGLIYLSHAFDLETTIPASQFYPHILGMSQYGESPYIGILSSTMSGNAVEMVSSTVSNVFLYLTLLIIFTNGIANVGSAYVMRSFVRSEPVFMFSDFFGAVKKNFKQAVVLGVIDAIFLYVFAYGTMMYFLNSGSFTGTVMLFAEILLFIIYLTMRFYMNIILITFDLKITKIIKNSFIFSIIGFKRNLCAWIGILFVLLINFYLLFTIPVLGVIIPFLITFGLLMYICAYAAYPVIQKYMIDPYYKDNPTANGSKITPADEPIFIDRG